MIEVGQECKKHKAGDEVLGVGVHIELNVRSENDVLLSIRESHNR